MKKIYLLPLIILLQFNFGLLAQNKVVPKFGKGITFTSADSSMSLKMGARFQTLFVAERSLAEGAPIYKNMQIRRFRLKFDGFAFTPRLEYKIELALSNRDAGAATVKQMGNTASLVLDAYAKYQLTDNIQIWAGQFKLPGNRERVISSQALQFVDRSNLNGAYNLDRDLGLQLHHNFKIGKLVIKDIYAIAIGEGRNVVQADTGGLNYITRWEFLPFGEFTNKGDYFDADLEREEKPKLSIGVGYSYNDGTPRSAGQLGSFLNESRDLSTFFADVMLKYQGWSFSSEYMNRKSTEPSVLKDNKTFFVTGDGWNMQSGYLFKNNVEVAARYTTVNKITALDQDEDEYTLGVSKYFLNHNLKIQSDLSLIDTEGNDDQDLRFRIQMELAL